MKKFIIQPLDIWHSQSKRTSLFVIQFAFKSLGEICYYGYDSKYESDSHVTESAVCVWHVKRKINPLLGGEFEPYVFTGLTLHSAN